MWDVREKVITNSPWANVGRRRQGKEEWVIRGGGRWMERKKYGVWSSLISRI